MKPFSIEVPAYAFTQDRKRVKRVFAAAGQEIAAQARRLIGKGGVSKPGQPPSSRTGTLKRSVRVKPLRRGLGVTIKDSVFYAKFMETGAQGGGRKGVRSRKPGSGQQTGRVMEPRPFLSTAFEMRRSSIERRVREAIEKGVKFERMKPSARL